MEHELMHDEEGFRKHIIERLNGVDLDFMEQMTLIRKKHKEGIQSSASGVLVPLEFDPAQKEYVIILNKRSPYVVQPGDLCCPGGGMDHRLERILGYLLGRNLIPHAWTGPFRRLPRLPGMEKEVFSVIFAGVLRESWEEMGLNPCNVEYLGGLPTHRVQSFPRYIFPVVGRIRKSWKEKLNWEVERIIRVPLRMFLDTDNYAMYSQILPLTLREMAGMDRWELPCLVIRDEGGEEILWGATFRILLYFVETVMDLPIEKINPQRRIERDLPTDYFTGRART